jgi:hypothetical protein
MTNEKIPFNIIIVFIAVFTLISLYWLSRLGLNAGDAYLWLTFIGAMFIVVATFAKISGLKFWYEIPISQSNERAILMLFFGLLIIAVFFGTSSITGANFYSPFIMSPLASFSLNIGAETFSALQAATSPFWTFVISVIGAATIEEIVLGWGFVTMGSLLLGYGLRKLLGIDFGKSGNHMWDFVMAISFSIIMFTVLHVFNSTYVDANGVWNTQAFTFAALFRAVLNVLMYKFGNFGLMFGIGVHAGNNAIFLGSSTVLAALATFPGGVILDALIVLMLFFALMSFKKVVKEGRLVYKDFLTFD